MTGTADDASTIRDATPNNTYACMLGGNEGRTLFVLTADDGHPSVVAGTATGAVYSSRVDSPRAGRP